jgi:hypothetical protein
MIRTEETLREALKVRAGEAASAADLLARLEARPPGRGRRRRNALLAAVLVVVLTVAGVAVFGHWLHDRRPTAGIPSPQPTPVVKSSLRMPLGPPFQYSFTIAPEAGFVVQGHEIRRWGERQTVSLPADPSLGVATVEVFRTAIPMTMIKGALFDSLGNWEAVQSGDPVAVAGHPGHLAEVMITGVTPDIAIERFMRAEAPGGVFRRDLGPPPPPARTPMLAWQYAPNSWAVAQWGEAGPQARAAVQRLAAAVRIGPRPAPVPFTIDSLPATVDKRVALWLDDQPATGMTVVFGDSSAPEADNNPWLSGIMINLSHGRNARPQATPKFALTPLLVNGRSAMWAPTERRLFVEIDPDWWLEVRQSPMSKAQKLSQAELLAVARSMRFATNIADRSTWFDAALALPH